LSTKGKLISFKIGTTPHALKASSIPERDGWHAALKEKIAEAMALKDEIVGKDSYKENVDKIGMSLDTSLTTN
jgi:hypothetical protein